MFKLPDGRTVIPRTELTYPGINREILSRADADPLRMSRNAADSEKAQVDHVMGDMEDACPFELKGEPVRKALAEAFSTIDFGGKVVTWRPNNIRSGYFEGDLSYMMKNAKDKFHGIVLPKTFGVADLEYVLSAVDFCEKLYRWETKVVLEILIETPMALQNVDRLAATLAESGRGAGLIFGIAYYASFLGVGNIMAEQHVRFAYAKQAMIAAAKAHGMHAIDNVFLRLPRRDDPPEVVEQIQQELVNKNLWSASFGMDGTWVIHPSQAARANECYTPSESDIKGYWDSLERSLLAGGGAIMDTDTGEMIDDAPLRIALQCLSKAVQAGRVPWADLNSMNQKITEVTGYDILAT